MRNCWRLALLLAAAALFTQRAIACDDVQLFAKQADGTTRPVRLETPACEAVRSHYRASDLSFLTGTFLFDRSAGPPQLGNTHSNPTEGERSNTELAQVKASVAKLASYCADLHAAAKSSDREANGLGCSLSAPPRTRGGRSLVETLMKNSASHETCGIGLFGASSWQTLRHALRLDDFVCSDDGCRRNIPALVLEPGNDPALVKATFAIQSIEIYRDTSVSAGVCVKPNSFITVMKLLIDR